MKYVTKGFKQIISRKDSHIAKSKSFKQRVAFILKKNITFYKYSISYFKWGRIKGEISF